MNSKEIILREATVADVPGMARIINDAAEFGLMLPKSLASLYENVREFRVACVKGPGDQGAEGSDKEQPGTRNPEPGTRVIGVGGLSIVWANLGEIVSLAVEPAYRGRGLGRRLAQACLDEAKRLGIGQVMTLTYEQAFFEKLGFAVVDRQKLPLKVWSECVRCPKNQACDEIAMIRVIQGVPELETPKPQAPSTDKYIVPTLRSAATEA